MQITPCDKVNTVIVKYNLDFSINDLKNRTPKSLFIGKMLNEIHCGPIKRSKFIQLYQDCIDICLKSDNWHCIHSLWLGHLNCEYPDYHRGLVVGVRIGGIMTFIMTYWNIVGTDKCILPPSNHAKIRQCMPFGAK
jgi:hypothetical protein